MPKQCNGCGADVKWITTENDKPMLVDLPPIHDPRRSGNEKEIPDGTVMINDAGQTVRKSSSTNNWDCAWYTSHWATCPNASQFRRPRSVVSSARKSGNY